jgi:hypothetical protein
LNDRISPKWAKNENQQIAKPFFSSLLSHHPWHLVRNIWQWEWHALMVWSLVAAITMPVLALYMRRALVLLMRRHRTLVRSRPALG